MSRSESEEYVRFEWNEEEQSHCGMVERNGKWEFIKPFVTMLAEYVNMMYQPGSSKSGFMEALEEMGFEFEDLE
ncbi:MAG: hypothetical protein FWC97_09270 [Treponema sp.]|nr:hypothetical protein [Treponema sp.]